MGKTEIEAFLSYLATERNVSASTQRQALNAIVFLYKQVLDLPVSEELEPVRAKRQVRPPVVMAKQEVQRVIVQMQGTHLLRARMLYGSGLRLMECIRLRIMDLDFERNLLYVRAAKGSKGPGKNNLLFSPVRMAGRPGGHLIFRSPSAALLSQHPRCSSGYTCGPGRSDRPNLT